jgi:hypothetical protein
VSTNAITGHALTVPTQASTSSTNTFRNNLIHLPNSNNGVCWEQAKGEGFACSGESYTDSATGIASWQGQVVGPRVSGNIAGNPLFANPSQGDFRLCVGPGTPVSNCTGKSPAIDAGANVGLSFQGLAPDIGAIESVPSTGGPPQQPIIISVTP